MLIDVVPRNRLGRWFTSRTRDSWLGVDVPFLVPPLTNPASSFSLSFAIFMQMTTGEVNSRWRPRMVSFVLIDVHSLMNVHDWEFAGRRFSPPLLHLHSRPRRTEARIATRYGYMGGISQAPSSFSRFSSSSSRTQNSFVRLFLFEECHVPRNNKVYTG